MTPDCASSAPGAIVYKVTMSGHFSPFSAQTGDFEGLPGLYLAHFLDALPIDADRRCALLAEANMAPEALSGSRRVALSRVLELIEAIDRQARPGWHIRPALDMEAAHHGPLGVAVISAPTVADALDTLTRFEVVRAPFVHLQSMSADKTWRVRIISTTATDGPWPVLMEINLLALAGLIRRLLGAGANRLRLRMPRCYRPWKRQLLEVLPRQIEIAGADYCLAVPGEMLQQACPLADARLHEDAVSRCQSLMAERFDCGPLEAEIRRRLLADIAHPPRQVDMARALGLSSRSLHRRLGERGRSYRRLLGEVRAGVAAYRLRYSRDPVSSIASDLGYQDTANFGRACRRWFGCSPGRLRRGPD